MSVNRFLQMKRSTFKTENAPLTTRAFMQFIIISLLCLCFVLSSRASIFDGIPLGGKAVHYSDERVTQEELSEYDLLGQDGLPAWFWPDFPAAQTIYRVEVDIPAACVLHGIRFVSAGGTSNPADSLQVRFSWNSGNNTAIINALQSQGTLQDEFAFLNEAVNINSAGILSIEIVVPDGSTGSWITADNICNSYNSSWISNAAIDSGTPVLVNHNLNLSALVSWPVGSSQAPVLYHAQENIVSSTDRFVGFDIISRDFEGTDTVFVMLETPAIGGFGLTRISSAGNISRWRGDINFEGIDLSGMPQISGNIIARDTLYYESVTPFSFEFNDRRFWQQDFGRGDEALTPVWPPLAGSAFALLVPISEIYSAAEVSDAVVNGGSVLVKGLGAFDMYLVADAGEGLTPEVVEGEGGFNHLNVISDTLTILPGEVCDTWLDFNFTLTDEQMFAQGDFIWLVQNFTYPATGPESAVSTLCEWRADADSLLENYSFSYDPVSQSWHELRGRSNLSANLLMRASYSGLSCDVDLPFEATFDEQYSELICWERGGDNVEFGWQVAAGIGANSSTNGGCFFLNSDPDSLFDPDSLQNGNFVFINSDKYDSLAFRDTLFTPWINFSGDLEFSFVSMYANESTDEAYVYFRVEEEDGISVWTYVTTTDEEFSRVDESIPLPCLEEDNFQPLWKNCEFPVDPHADIGKIQFAFEYRGEYAYGWGIDNIRVSQSNSINSYEWEKPLVKQAELGRAYPNPFNPITNIPYRLLENGPLEITVYNLQGQRIRTLLDDPEHPAGEFQIAFSPDNLASGMYFVRLQSVNSQEIRRLLFLK
jgi:hypothetical protein